MYMFITGECISPAGKRRTPALTELGEYSLHSQGVESSFSLNYITVIVVAFCATTVLVFAVIFTFLQVSFMLTLLCTQEITCKAINSNYCDFKLFTAKI